MVLGATFFVINMMNAVLGKKIDQTQKFLINGDRIPVTIIEANDNFIAQIKTNTKHGYWSIQLGFGKKKNPTKAELGHIKKGANLDYAPNFLEEVRVLEEIKMEDLPKLGEIIDLTSVFTIGDLVNVTGVSKGKGFAGVVKRHHFKGGPRTHGQSDRERAPGSIGQTTTPGRVYKNKRMAGKMGFENVTVKNLEIVGVKKNSLLIKGLVPGIKKSKLLIQKKGKVKNPSLLLENKQEEIKKEEKQ